MSNTLEFTVPGEPVAKARPRMTKSGHTYTPKKTVVYENEVRQACLSAMKDRNVAQWSEKQPLMVFITAKFKLPKSATKKDKQAVREYRKYPVKKPDADNVAKAICDAINGIAYSDDSQVVYLSVKKFYTLEEPRVIVKIREVDV